MFVKYLVDEGVDCFVLKDVVYIINCDFFLNCQCFGNKVFLVVQAVEVLFKEWVEVEDCFIVEFEVGWQGSIYYFFQGIEVIICNLVLEFDLCFVDDWRFINNGQQQFGLIGGWWLIGNFQDECVVLFGFFEFYFYLFVEFGFWYQGFWYFVGKWFRYCQWKDDCDVGLCGWCWVQLFF